MLVSNDLISVRFFYLLMCQLFLVIGNKNILISFKYYQLSEFHGS